MIETHADNHEWNRRYATQVELSRFFQTDKGYEMLNSAFQYVERTEQISIHEINEKFEQTPELRIASYRLLSFYESLARGIFQGIYDEEVVKESQQNEMIRIYEIFKNFIEARRKSVDQGTYDNIEKIVNQWKEIKQECYKLDILITHRV